MAIRKRTIRRQPERPTSDALRLAALRWYTLTLDRLAIEIYATDPGKFNMMSELFRLQVKKLARLGKRAMVAEGCPDGYVLCKDGLCSPMCDGDFGLED